MRFNPFSGLFELGSSKKTVIKGGGGGGISDILAGDNITVSKHGNKVTVSSTASGSDTKSVVTAADATSITPNTDSADITYQLNTQAAGTLTINADSGTPVNGQSWLLKIKSTNAQTLSWNSGYIGGTTALPTATTGSSKIDYYAFIYDTVSSKWNYTGSAVGFT